MTVEKLTFADEFEEPLLSGTKTQTLRYNLSEKPTVGSELTVYLAESGEQLGTLTVTDVESIPVSDVSEREFSGHKNYASTDEVIAHLGQYYHDTIMPSDTVTLISFAVNPSG